MQKIWKENYTTIAIQFFTSYNVNAIKTKDEHKNTLKIFVSNFLPAKKFAPNIKLPKKFLIENTKKEIFFLIKAINSTNF